MPTLARLAIAAATVAATTAMTLVISYAMAPDGAVYDQGRRIDATPVPTALLGAAGTVALEAGDLVARPYFADGR